MIFLHDQSNVNHEDMTQQNRRIAEQTLKFTSKSEDIKDDVARHCAGISTLAFDDTKIWADVERVSKRHITTLLQIIRGLTERLEQLDNQLKREVQELLPKMARDTRARRQVLASLSCLKIDHRRNRISRAHGNTYQWIFKRKDNETVVWDDFVDWLHNSKQPIYWVTGKPGSGKSTLIRELDERASALHPSYGSVDAAKFILASFYFWYAGNNEEKSISGLLSSLIHQLLLPHLELVDQVISDSKWEDALVTPQLYQWEKVELVEILHKTVQHLERDNRILLFIDGLDEHDASDEERQEILELLQTITKGENVKACVASRPWNIFWDAFEGCPQLRLEALTKDDIRLYVSGKLGTNPHFRRIQVGEPQLLQIISDEIVDKARGVFLWVHLVVRDLSRVLRDGGRSKQLLRELRSIPPDLDDYFQRILESVEASYRGEAAIILQTALLSMGGDSKIPRHSSPDFLLMHLNFLEESDDLCFAAKSHLYPIGLDHIHQVQEFLELLERILSSRCMGLLEVDTDPSPDSEPPVRQKPRSVILRPWKTRIEFLHRTVRDYFATSTGSQLLHQYRRIPFDAHMFSCNLLVTNMTTKTINNPPLAIKYESVTSFLYHIRSRPDAGEAAFTLFDKMVDLIHEHAFVLRSKAERAPSAADFNGPLCQWVEHQSTAMSLAIQLNWSAYIRARLTPALVQEKRGRPLIDYALTSSPKTGCMTVTGIERMLMSQSATITDNIDRGNTAIGKLSSTTPLNQTTKKRRLSRSERSGGNRKSRQQTIARFLETHN